MLLVLSLVLLVGCAKSDPAQASTGPASETGAPESAVSETEILETEVPETAVYETGILELETEILETETPETAVSDTAVPETESSAENALAETLLNNMTLEEKVCQMFIVTQEQLTGYSLVTQSGQVSEEAIARYPVGGIVYFAANLISRDQTKAMIDGIQSYSKLGLFIAVDEEGGSVSRIGCNPDLGTTAFPSMGEIGAMGDTDAAYRVGHTIGSEISELGFNLDFAPVADVFSNPENTVIGSRAFSSDAALTAEMVSACVTGFKDSGMLCTLKHFPGHGDTAEDSHYGAAWTDKTLEQLTASEFLPFAAGIDAGAEFVMIGHITAPNVTGDDVPATFSYEIVTQLLRDTLGFDGIVITDSMMMQAVTDFYSAGEAAVMAIQAGIDIVLGPENLAEAVDAVISAVDTGKISETRINESVMRILQLKIDRGIISSEE